ncbi:flagellar motor protein MotB [Variovorax sp. PAMC 28711]|uniref:flagellar motor protein MotB n=1 Tax=Variovorax sp. PAMC 28711 TaxID=1795631 RepID=UPI0009EB875B|nr:flagellar motor protein MotB [Variovorax sp. PAMC 28711]
MATSPGTKKLQPIIIKRVKKTAHAHHGGAWKIAYADFVTAMMAFFLLMWLLGSTAKGDLQGIASYFNSPLQVAMPGGSGAGNSSSIIPGGGTDLTRSVGQVRKSQGQNNDRARMNDDDMKREAASQDARRMASLQQKIERLINESPILKEFRSQVRLEVTLDGLEIQIVDAQNRPMFDTGAALVKPYMRDILRAIGTSLNGVENRVSLAGHTDAAPYGNGDRGYGNWELSADRANASRRELVASGMPDEKLVRVVGLAASDLMDKTNALSPVNRRISITVLTREAESRLLGTARMDAPDAVKAITDQVQRDRKAADKVAEKAPQKIAGTGSTGN